MTDKKLIEGLRIPTPDNPLRILMSACLVGVQCGYDGSSYGEYPGVLKLLSYNTVRCVRFCPEEFSFGTPREMCDIHGGTGIEVLDKKASVITETGKDWTAGMIKASEEMLHIAVRERVEIAIMMDISAACGSQVIYDGSRFDLNKKYQIGAGVCATQLRRNGFLVISQRDFATLEILYSKVDRNHVIDGSKMDHHETDWYKHYFPKKLTD